MTTLLVASGGGHLTELHLLAPRFDPPVEDAHWVTYDIPQARSLLAGQSVTYCFSPTTRHVPNAVRNLGLAGRLLETLDVERVVSTGAGVAVPFLLRARRRGIEAHYVECSTRVTAPSLSGRLLERVPGVHLYAQYDSWSRGRWAYAGSILDEFLAVEAPPSGPVRKLVVVLGTHRYAFSALVYAVRALVDDADDITWQVGATEHVDLPGRVHRALPASELEELIRGADVVIGHAGIGTAISALVNGKVPVLVPRRRSRGEHVDDHQVPLAVELQRRGLAVCTEPAALTRELVERAASSRVERATEMARFRLARPGSLPAAPGEAGP